MEAVTSVGSDTIPPISGLDLLEDNTQPSSPWVRIHVDKRSNRSAIPFRTPETVDMRTRERFRGDDQEVVAIKCALLFIGTPLVYAGSCIWHLLRIPTHFFSIPIQEVNSYIEGDINLGQLLYNIPTKISKSWLNGIWSVVRGAFFLLALQLTALFGIVAPYQGRSYYGALEKSWGHSLSKEVSLQKLGWEIVPKAFLDTETRYTFFLAYCFQSLGYLPSNAHIHPNGVIDHAARSDILSIRSIESVSGWC